MAIQKPFQISTKFAEFFFPGKVPLNDPFWIGGRICITCILENKPLSISAAHLDFGVCVQHRQKCHAFCPRCYEPASSNWLFEKRCANCHHHIYKFGRLKCSTEELEVAKVIWRWLRGASPINNNAILQGLWSQPWYLRPWLLRSLMKLVVPIKVNASCAELSWRCDESRRWLLQHAGDWQMAAMSRFAERYPAPAEGAPFAHYIAWLNCGIGGKAWRSDWPKEISNGTYELLPQLVCNGLLPAIKTKGTLRSTPRQKQFKTQKKETISTAKNVEPKCCQMKLAITPDPQHPNPSVESLSVLNTKKIKRARTKQSRFDGKWRFGNPQYLFATSTKTPLDVFASSIQSIVPKRIDNTKRLTPLHAILYRTSAKRRTVLESELVLGRLPFYQIDHSGHYWRDLAVDIDELGACERNIKGGDHVSNQLF